MNLIQARLLVILLRLELLVNSLAKSWKEKWQHGFDKWVQIVGWTVVAVAVVSLCIHASGMCGLKSDSAFCNFIGPGLYKAIGT